MTNMQPCRECGGAPREFSHELVEEITFAPIDSKGRPNLWATLEQGIRGGRYLDTLTCVNGHVTVTEEIQKWGD